MANRTVSDAIAVHGTNPQYLIEKIIRTRIYESLYWKEFCFGLTAETLIDKAIELTSFGGEYGNQKPTEFLCLTCKLLQLQPSKEIVLEFIRNEEYKYLRALGAFYLRLVGNSLEIYQTLEPLLNDYRKLRKRTNDGDFEIVCMDVFIDELLREERACDTILPRILKRHVLEENGELEPQGIKVIVDQELLRQGDIVGADQSHLREEVEIGGLIDTFQVIIVVIEGVSVYHPVPDHVRDQEVMIDMNQVTVEVNHSLLLHIDLHAIDLIQEVTVEINER
ncbi:10184_t:CDS:2 [Funneliformis geosporum]|uniref:Pre-mRNA-splicing factor 38 n=1 Tax=Funneliformis geosporum TaxID=1117311 RepID=A0A9W4SLI7_9GLOM|nr:10184_t:CDS:2 [Funneliformis geosporum]